MIRSTWLPYGLHVSMFYAEETVDNNGFLYDDTRKCAQNDRHSYWHMYHFQLGDQKNTHVHVHDESFILPLSTADALQGLYSVFATPTGR